MKKTKIDNENTDNNFIVPPLISKFELLKANKSFNFRKDLVNHLNEFFPTKQLTYTTWKNRFLYPVQNIPKGEFEKIIKIMEEVLAFHLNKMKDAIQEEINNYAKLIFEIDEAIKTYENEQNI